MIEEMKTVYRYLIVMGAGLLFLMISLMIPVLSTDADFSVYNRDWNGCSKLGKEVYGTGSLLPSIDISGSSEEIVAHSSLTEMSDLLEPESSVIIIIGPRTDFNDDEIGSVDTFLRRGGLLFLADDFGTGNELLSGLDTDTRISGEMMLDLAYRLLVRARIDGVLREMLEHSLELAREANGSDFRPLTVLQLTFSGRYSKPDGKPAPIDVDPVSAVHHAFPGTGSRQTRSRIGIRMVTDSPTDSR